MLNKTKRFLSIILCFTLLATLMLVPAAATDTYKIDEDFESTYTYFADNSSIHEFGGDYGKVLKVDRAAGEQKVTSASGLNMAGAQNANGGFMVLSMDYYTTDNNVHFAVNTYAADMTAPASSLIIGNGNAYCGGAKNYLGDMDNINNLDNAASTTYTQPSASGEWHNLMMYIRFKTATNEDDYAHMFVDGKLVRTASFKSAGNTMDKISVGTVATGTGDGSLYIDNVKFFFDKADTYTATAAYDGTYVTVKTSNIANVNNVWTPSSVTYTYFNGTTLKNSSDETVGSTIYSQTANSVVILPNEPLADGIYTITFPSTAKTYQSARVLPSATFMVGSVGGGEITPPTPPATNEPTPDENGYIVNEDFNNSPFAGVRDFTDAEGVELEGVHSGVIKLKNTTDTAQSYSTSSRRFSPAIGAVDQTLSFDIYLGQTDTQYVLDLETAGGADLASLLFDQEGNVVAAVSNNMAGYTEASENNRNTRIDKGAYAAYTANEWHNVTLYIDYRDSGFDYVYGFLDGVKFCQFGHALGSTSGIEGLSFITPTGKVSDTKTCYIDNVRLHTVGNDTFYPSAIQYSDDEKIYLTLSEMMGEGATNKFDGTILTDGLGNTIDYDIISKNKCEFVIKPKTSLNVGKVYTLTLPSTLTRFVGGPDAGDSKKPSSGLASNIATFTAKTGIYTEVYADTFGLCDGASADVTTATAGTFYADAVIKNPLSESKTVLVTAIAYNGYTMAASGSREFTIPAGGTLTLDNSSEYPVSVTASSATDLTLSVLLLEKSANGYNLITKSDVTNMTGELTPNDRTFTYEGTANTADNLIVYDFKTEDKTTLLQRAVVKSGADKKYTISFNMPDGYNSNNYSLTVYEYGKAAVEIPVVYRNPTEKTIAITTINNDPTQIDSILSTSAFLFIDNDISKIVDYDKVETIVSDYITENGDLTEANASTVINKAAFIVAAQDGQLSNVFNYATSLDMANSSIGTLYNKSYVGTTVQGYVTDRLKNTTATTFSAFDADLKKAFILSMVQYPDGIDNLKEVLNAFYTEIGITQNAENYRYTAVENNNYTDYATLASAFNNATKPDDGYQGGYSGPSVSIGSTGIGTTYVPKDPTPLVVNIFNDVADDYWGRDAIVAIAQLGIVNGKGDGNFYPEQNITREEFVKIVMEALDIDTAQSGADFYDADKNAWYYPYIAAAVNNGIITGYADGSFGVGQNITRQDMCVILCRAAEKAGFDLVKKNDAIFQDFTSISDYAQGSVTILNSEGIINGYESGEFLPMNNSTRAECATIIYNFLDLFNKL